MSRSLCDLCGEKLERVRMGQKRNPPICSGCNTCAICLDEGWVCENHPYQKWEEGDPPCCGGAGAPCQCNPLFDVGKDKP